MIVISPQELLNEEISFLRLGKGLSISKTQVRVSAFKYILRFNLSKLLPKWSIFYFK